MSSCLVVGRFIAISRWECGWFVVFWGVGGCLSVCARMLLRLFSIICVLGFLFVSSC